MPVRITSNRLAVMDLPTGPDKVRLSTIRFAVVHGMTEQNPDFPAGQHTIQMT